jgi:hypothetical protein
MIEEERQCKNCSKRIKQEKRSDTDFCKDGCRIDWHNKQRAWRRKKYAPVENVLHKNYEILTTLLGKKRYVEITKVKLENMGFRFNFCTLVMGSYRYCYFYSYKPKDPKSEEIYAISVASENINDFFKHN